MKAVGLSIVLAQAGMYVPCTEMELAPYRNLFSRMSKNDDIQRGQSTFMVEMSELRNILKRADSYSMVIGDEICSGTESTSALAIVAASIQSLAEANTNFLFATHLHDLSKLSIPSQIKEYHLHVEYNSDMQQLVYYRDLRPGQGSALYGIEVCRALTMDERFLSRAIQIRNSLTSSTPRIAPGAKRSVYEPMLASCP
jgi:DNA mismatch repair protein MutS